MLVKQCYNQCKVSPSHHNVQQELHCSPLELVKCLTFSLLYPLNFTMGSIGKFIQILKTEDITTKYGFQLEIGHWNMIGGPFTKKKSLKCMQHF